MAAGTAAYAVRRTDTGAAETWHLSPGMAVGTECLVCASSDPYAPMEVIARIVDSDREVVAHVPCFADMRARGLVG